MKILTWNCNGAFRKKYHLLQDYDADILLIQECENPKTCADNAYTLWAKNHLWIGRINHKGLGIFYKDGIHVDKILWNPDVFEFFLPCQINQSWNLIAVWCHGAHNLTFEYIGQLWKYMQLHKSKFGNCIIAGDFNGNAYEHWHKKDHWWNYSDVVDELDELNIKNIYNHLYPQEPPSKETRPTFYLHKNKDKPYHIDHIFATASHLPFIKSFHIGSFDDWIKYSDHMPLVCDIQM
jgi:exonuclease III